MKHSSPFVIQPLDTLGVVDTEQHDAQFSDAVGDVARDRGQASFLGSSLTSKRLFIGLAVLGALFVLLMGRAAYLQLYEGKAFYLLAEGNRIREDVLPAQRGEIHDRSGTVLVRNAPAFSLWVDRSWVDEQDPAYAGHVSELAILLDVEDRVVHDRLLKDRTRTERILLTQDLDRETALHVLANEELYAGLHVIAGSRRAYDVGAAKTLSPLLGYIGQLSADEYTQVRQRGYRQNDLIGKTGLERTHEVALRGHPGLRRIEVDAIGREELILEERLPVDGSALTLHVDADLQAYIEARLGELQETVTFQNASVVVLDPRDGGVRALVSYPGFDANAFIGGIEPESYQALISDPAAPLFPRAISGQYPSGSTFKPVVAATALAVDVIDERTSFVSSGGLRIGQFYFPDWKSGGHGVTDVRKALAESVNTFFYIIGGGFRDIPGLGLDQITDGARAFGLGTPLGIDLPGESGGFLPTAQWKREVKGEPWYIGDTYHVAIGQGDILVTPLQVAAFTMVFANGGTLYQPQVVDRYASPAGEHDIQPVILRSDTVDAAAIDVVRQGLRQAVTDGSAVRLNTLPVSAAGKTGTAQWHSARQPHAWFTGFAPYDQPEIVVTVLIEEGGEGSAVAVPLADDIVRWWFYHDQ